MHASQSVNRKISNPSSGWVIFGRNTRPTEEITIPQGTRVATTSTPVIEFETTKEEVLETTSDMLNKLNKEVLNAYSSQLKILENELKGKKDDLKDQAKPDLEEVSYAKLSKEIGEKRKAISEKMNQISRMDFVWLEQGINIRLVLGKPPPVSEEEAVVCEEEEQVWTEAKARVCWIEMNRDLVKLQDELTSLTSQLDEQAAAIENVKRDISELNQAIDDLTLKHDEVKGKSEDLEEMLLELYDLNEILEKYSSQLEILEYATEEMEELAKTKEDKRTQVIDDVFDPEVAPNVSALFTDPRGRDRVGEVTVDELKDRGVWPWEVKVPIRAVNPGLAGDVNPGEIGAIPVPIPGIDYVRNEEETSEGRDPETDDDLRERAKKALQVAARATARAHIIGS